MREISDFLYRRFSQVTPSGGGTDLRADCPFCRSRTGSDDNKQHLYVSTVKEACHCFRCDYSSSWVGLVMEVTGMTYAMALGEIYTTPNPVDINRVKEQLERFHGSAWVRNKVPTLPDDFTLLDGVGLDKDSDYLIKKARKYLAKRGFWSDMYVQHKLGIAPSIGYRVIIPIEGDYWQARSLFSFIKPKYINPEAESRDLLFNSKALELYEEVVICEGAFSAMAVGGNAIALIGKSATSEKLDRLRLSNVSHFIITIEKGAGLAMSTLADALLGFGKTVTVWKYDEGDPADSDNYTEKPYDLKTKMEILLESCRKY